ncbi:hypothetical protein L208DRAFT_1236146, partial [Tricholoma matsutake]
QFDEMKHSKWIVHTIAYHMAHRCKPFTDALSCSEKFDTIHLSRLIPPTGIPIIFCHLSQLPCITAHLLSAAPRDEILSFPI